MYFFISILIFFFFKSTNFNLKISYQREQNASKNNFIISDLALNGVGPLKARRRMTIDPRNDAVSWKSEIATFQFSHVVQRKPRKEVPDSDLFGDPKKVQIQHPQPPTPPPRPTLRSLILPLCLGSEKIPSPSPFFPFSPPIFHNS